MARDRKRTELRRDTVDIEVQAPCDDDFARVVDQFVADVKHAVSGGIYARISIEVHVGDHGFRFVRSSRGVSERD